MTYWNLSFFSHIFVVKGGVHHRWSYLNIDFTVLFAVGSSGVPSDLFFSCAALVSSCIFFFLSPTFLLVLAAVDAAGRNAFELLFVLSKEHQSSLEAATLLLRFLNFFFCFSSIISTRPRLLGERPKHFMVSNAPHYSSFLSVGN